MRLHLIRKDAAVKEGCLGDTLGKEDTVFVFVEQSELPSNWGSVNIFAEGIGDSIVRDELDGANDPPFKVSLDKAWRDDIQSAARNLQKGMQVTLGDRHCDAKLFPHMHPWGSGSLRADETSGGMQQYIKNRLLSLDHIFRRSAVWSFWQLERHIKNTLFFSHGKGKLFKDMKRLGKSVVAPV